VSRRRGGIAQKTGFGLVSPQPGIWPSLHLETAITLSVGVEAYAAYALRAWLASEHAVSARTRRFARWSAIFSFALGMAEQVAYHLLAQDLGRPAVGVVGILHPNRSEFDHARITLDGEPLSIYA
jgi:hypothetical protein